MPRVSVIIPAYRAAAVIGRTLDSVRAQTFADWEVIVADDVSGDDTAATAEAHAARPVVVATDRNCGPAGARNRALREASGELVALLDADDEWMPTYLESQVRRHDEESARSGAPVGFVACDARIRQLDGELAPHTYLEQFRDPCEPLTVERLLKRNCVFISALVPRAAGDAVGWFDEGLFGTEDHDLWLRILETGRRGVLNREVLATYSHGEGSVSARISRMGANNQKTYLRALERGHLTPAQEQLARRELRYNRAMEAVAAAWFERRPGALARALPTAVGVAATRRQHWGDWARVLLRR